MQCPKARRFFFLICIITFAAEVSAIKGLPSLVNLFNIMPKLFKQKYLQINSGEVRDENMQPCSSKCLLQVDSALNCIGHPVFLSLCNRLGGAVSGWLTGVVERCLGEAVEGFIEEAEEGFLGDTQVGFPEDTEEDCSLNVLRLNKGTLFISGAC